MNDGVIDDWVYTGRGVSPTLRWSFTVDAPLIDIRLGRETGEVIAADAAGVLYLLDRRGRVQSQSRTRHQYQRVAWSDNGTAGAAAYDNVMVGWFDRKLQFRWTREHAAQSSEKCAVLLLRQVCFGTQRRWRTQWLHVKRSTQQLLKMA